MVKNYRPLVILKIIPCSSVMLPGIIWSLRSPWASNFNHALQSSQYLYTLLFSTILFSVGVVWQTKSTILWSTSRSTWTPWSRQWETVQERWQRWIQLWCRHSNSYWNWQEGMQYYNTHVVCMWYMCDINVLWIWYMYDMLWCSWALWCDTNEVHMWNSCGMHLLSMYNIQFWCTQCRPN